MAREGIPEGLLPVRRFTHKGPSGYTLEVEEYQLAWKDGNIKLLWVEADHLYESSKTDGTEVPVAHADFSLLHEHGEDLARRAVCRAFETHYGL